MSFKGAPIALDRFDGLIDRHGILCSFLLREGEQHEDSEFKEKEDQKPAEEDVVFH